MATFHVTEFQHYSGDDAMFKNFDAEDWLDVEADSMDDALEQVTRELRLYYPHVKQWQPFTERTGGGDTWVSVWVEAAHASHYLQLGDLAQDSIWLFAIADDPAYQMLCR